MPSDGRMPVDVLNCTPEKRSYWSIINDYDFNTALCELIDNPIDQWRKRGGVLNVNIGINVANQTVRIEDDSGGITPNELPLIVRPGASANTQNEATIGIFGVGSKRSVVALAKKVVITTRARRQPALTLEYGDEWLNDPSWDLPYYHAVLPCEERHTIIELSELRDPVEETIINDLKKHLGETYGKFLLDHRFQLKVNDESVQPVLFENWAFPPEFSPKQFEGSITTSDNQLIKMQAMGGLITESAYSSGEYGVYFYFNDRLIAKGLKIPEVGFGKGAAGVPHHSHSIARAIISLEGPAKWMPWNSSKSGIHYGHETYKKIQEVVVEVTTCYAKVATRLLNRWDDEVFPHKTGDIQRHRIKDYGSIKRCPLPEIPRVRPNYAENVNDNNRAIIADKPWTRGLVESIVVVDCIQKQRVRAKNRIALIVLDGLVELAFKEFLLNETGNQYTDEKWLELVSDRDRLIAEVKNHKELSAHVVGQLMLLHNLRLGLIRNRSITQIDELTDAAIDHLRG